MYYIYIYIYLHPSAWEYQSAALGYNYHTARQSGAATIRYISYHPVITSLSPSDITLLRSHSVSFVTT